MGQALARRAVVPQMCFLRQKVSAFYHKAIGFSRQILKGLFPTLISASKPMFP